MASDWLLGTLGRPILFSGPMIRAILREIEAPGTGKTQTRRLLKLPKGFRCEDLAKTDPELFSGISVNDAYRWGDPYGDDGGPLSIIYAAPYSVGDLLWVRETWQVVRSTLDYETGSEYDCFPWDDDYGDPRPFLGRDARQGLAADLYYAADGEETNPSNFYALTSLDGKKVLQKPEIPWRPSIHMPRWASRLTLEVTDVKVERVNDISQDDAIAEGIEKDHAAGMPAIWGWRDYLRGDALAKRHFADPRASFGTLWDVINGAGSWLANPWVVAITFRPHRCNITRFALNREGNAHA